MARNLNLLQLWLKNQRSLFFWVQKDNLSQPLIHVFIRGKIPRPIIEAILQLANAEKNAEPYNHERSINTVLGSIVHYHHSSSLSSITDLTSSLEILLVSVLRLVCCLVINVHVSSLYIRKTLKLNLELLSHVMCMSQTAFGVHDNINLSDESGAGVVDTDCIDAFDLWGVGKADIGDELLGLD